MFTYLFVTPDLHRVGQTSTRDLRVVGDCRRKNGTMTYAIFNSTQDGLGGVGRCRSRFAGVFFSSTVISSIRESVECQ